MARSLTVKHEESPSALFATFLILCGGFLLLGAVLGASAEADRPEGAQVGVEAPIQAAVPGR
ncbi:MAG: hypothetical protein R3F59_19630 [Myxococcota bacterium]